jgi:hypothetical protein
MATGAGPLAARHPRLVTPVDSAVASVALMPALRLGTAAFRAGEISPEISWSTRSIQPNTNKVTVAQTSPRMANHVMCQINANPVTTAKKAVTKPLGLRGGTAIGSYCRRRRAEAVLFHFPKRIHGVHARQHGEVVMRRRRGGGPLQGAPVPGITGDIAARSRERMLTTSCAMVAMMPQRMTTAPTSATMR